jgi:cytochrome c oxidase subunit IV
MSARTRHAAHAPVARLGSLLGVWGALLAFLALTVASSFVRLGAWNLVINLAIAGAKAGLVAIFFMHLRTGSTLLRLVAAAALMWLTIMLTLTLADVLTRG